MTNLDDAFLHPSKGSVYLSFFFRFFRWKHILYSKIDELVQNQNFESNSSFEKINKRRIILVEVIYVTAGFELIIEVEKLNRAFIAKMKFDSWRIVLLYYSLGNGQSRCDPTFFATLRAIETTRLGKKTSPLTNHHSCHDDRNTRLRIKTRTKENRSVLLRERLNKKSKERILRNLDEFRFLRVLRARVYTMECVDRNAHSCYPSRGDGLDSRFQGIATCRYEI